MRRADSVDVMIKSMNQGAAILTGSIGSGNIQFHVDQELGVEQGQTAAPWPSSLPRRSDSNLPTLYREQQEGTCNGRQIVLKRNGP